MTTNLPSPEACHNSLFECFSLHSARNVLIREVEISEDLAQLDLKPCPVEGYVGDSLDSAVVENVGNQEHSSYLFNSWGLKTGDR